MMNFLSLNESVPLRIYDRKALVDESVKWNLLGKM